MANVVITRRDSVLDQLELVRHRIAQRAYELFRHRDGGPEDPVADWLAAEREILWTPAIEVSEKDGTFTILAALAGVEPKDVRVEVSAQDLVIKGETAHTHPKSQGWVHRCEFTTGQLFRAVRFPKPVDPAKAKTVYRNGLLTVTVSIASKAQAKRDGTKAA